MLQAIGIKDVLSVRLTGCAAVLHNLDGCLISGEPVLGGVPELFDWVGDVLWITSNNSTDTTISLSARLVGMSLTIAPGQIFLADEQTLRRIAVEQPGARIALNAAAPMHDLARDLGLISDHKHPQVAVLAREPDFAFGDLRELTAHLQGRSRSQNDKRIHVRCKSRQCGHALLIEPKAGPELHDCRQPK